MVVVDRAASSLRRHDPDQLLTVGAGAAPSQPPSPGAPVASMLPRARRAPGGRPRNGTGTLRESSGMTTRADRLGRLERARLYLVCDARPGGRALAGVLGPALAGGVDVFQLRDKTADEGGLLAAAAVARELCAAAGALFILNDRPDLVAAAGADGAHVGQDDLPVAEARRLAGPEAIVGRSTHTPEQVRAAHAGGADYLGVGPVHATPTKPGRPAVGLELVAFAARSASRPWFAIGGITPQNAGEAVAAGAARCVVVRAIAEAADPQAAARALRAALTVRELPPPGQPLAAEAARGAA